MTPTYATRCRTCGHRLPPALQGAAKLAAQRRRRGITQRQIARAAGCCVELVSKFELGLRSAPDALLGAYARLLR